jgi:hypothetical protein
MTSTPVPTSALEKAARVRLAERTNRGDACKAVCGRAVPTIVDYAKNHAVDLIVMGTQGRTGIAHLIIGSVAEGVVRTAPCPVLTTKPVAVGARTTETAGEAIAAGRVEHPHTLQRSSASDRAFA